MRVIGIDPGTLATGYGVVDEKKGRLFCLEAGSVRSLPGTPLPKRLHAIHERLAGIIQKFSPDAVGVEKTFVSKNAQSALKLGQAHGVALLVAEQAGLPVCEFNPTEIKLAVVGFGAAKKEQVSVMVTRLLELKGRPESEHAADALAAAICFHHTRSFRQLSASAGVGKEGLLRGRRRTKQRWTSVPKGIS